MTRNQVLTLYNTCLPAGLAAMLPGSLRKMKRRGGYGANFAQRLGIFSAETAAKFRQPADFWLHAVSVGEVLVARKLIDRLIELDPALCIALSTTTSTGFGVASRGAPESVVPIYNPLDLPAIVDRALETIRPRHLVLVEAEVWPNLVSRARRDGVAVSLVNARMSERSAARFARIRPLVEPIFSMLGRVLVQHDADVARWTALGVPWNRVRSVGSIKFDDEAAPPPAGVDRFRAILDACWRPSRPDGRRIVLAASTHPGEEKLIAQVCRGLRNEFPDLVFAAAPRHFERASEAADDLAGMGLDVRLRSRISPDAAAAPEPDALIIDSTGELRGWTELADIVVVGKSFLARGGQNPMEAVAARKPVVFGAHMQNFRAAVDEMVAAGGAIQTDGPAALEAALRRLLGDPDAARRQAENALPTLVRHRGAARRTAEILLAAQPNSSRSCASGFVS